MPDSADRPTPVADQYASGGSWVVVVRGELDLGSLPPLRQVVETASVVHPVLVLDLGDVTFADSSTLNLLLVAHRATTLRIAAPQPQVLRLLEVTGADRILRIYPTTGLACEAGAPDTDTPTRP